MVAVLVAALEEAHLVGEVLVVAVMVATQGQATAAASSHLHQRLVPRALTTVWQAVAALPATTSPYPHPHPHPGAATPFRQAVAAIVAAMAREALVA